MFKTVVLFSIVGFSLISFIPLGLVSFLLSLFGLGRPMRFIVYKTAQAWSRFLIWGTGCSLSAEGMEHIPRKGRLCIAANHQSIFDILLALALAGRPLGFIAKKELALIPLLNIWILLLGGLFIDRKNTRRALTTINKGIERIRKGDAMIVFPEGTRSKGRGLLPFKPGSLKLATRAGALVVPMAIAGSYDVFEKTYRVRAAPVRVVFSPAIDTAALSAEGRKRNLADQVCRVIAEALGEKLPDAPDGALADKKAPPDL
ncbi:MAG: 1-acyl-sn-glycerol-3-phosphate acyltransferase [Treponema sp.]|jgi:1-acyl-sn-glycerol-3-phosphate acyltransferase|nr:1-acyl-sn-glycerol-3-phosphate acyltransferase [Treponema sp.]